ncbi:hypothetical protein [Streptomyces sp. NPDC014006]|uniref:hypothetical protein n=1 Tax=Streptomyces sp. NPDC014006 TaxID=3364870 RepID=UPI0036F58859
MLLSDDERAVLERWTWRASSAQALAVRARIVLACAGKDVPPIVTVARELRLAADTVRKRRCRFLAERLHGRVDEPRPDWPPTSSVDQVEAVVVTTLEEILKNATHWSRKSMAEHSGRFPSHPRFPTLPLLHGGRTGAVEEGPSPVFSAACPTES